MTILKKHFITLLDWFEKLKGSRELIPLVIDNDPSHHFKFEMTDNETNNISTVSLHCDEKRYEVKYKNWFIPNRLVHVFKVYPVFSEDAPEDVRSLFSTELCIADLWHGLISTEEQKKAAIRGFIDIMYLNAKTKK